MGKEYRSKGWQLVLQRIATGEIKGNAAAAMFALKNYDKDKFKDRHEVEVKGSVAFTLDTGIRRLGDAGYDEYADDNDIDGECSVIPDNSHLDDL